MAVRVDRSTLCVAKLPALEQPVAGKPYPVQMWEASMAALFDETVRVAVLDGWILVGRLRPATLTGYGSSEAEAKTALMNKAAHLSAVII